MATTTNNGLIPGLPDDMSMECLIRVPIACHPTLRLVSHQWKSAISDPSFYSHRRRRSSAGEHLIFLIQPLSPPPPPQSKLADPPLYHLNVYNPCRREWRRLSAGSDVAIPSFSQCVALQEIGKLVLFGGWDPATLEPVKRVMVFDIAAGTWKYGEEMPTARSFFACAAVGPASVYVAGGHDGQKNALRSAEVYDVEADRWEALPPMADERDESHGLSEGGKFFWVISGYGTESQGRFRSDAEVFDPDTRTWSKIEGVWPYPGTTPKCTAVTAIGSRRRWWFGVGGEVREFDWEEKVWRRVVNLGRVPNQVSGSSSIWLVDVGGCSGGGDGRVLVMVNGGGGEEGVFMIRRGEEDKKGERGGLNCNWIWEHVHCSCEFLGLPFSTSHLHI